MNRQKLALTILLVVLAGSIVYSYFRMPRQKTVSRLTYTSRTPVPVKRPAGRPTSAVPAPPKADDKKLHLSLLDNVPPRFSGFRRNIFQPLFHEEVKAPSLPLPAPPVRSSLPKPPPPPPAALSTPPAAPQPTPLQQEMAKFTFLGFLKKDNRKTIFLSSNNEIFLVKKGDKIAGKYDVTNITDDALTITVMADGSEIIIPLVENKPLSAPRK